MSHHLTDALLHRFVLGQLDEPVAVSAAEHIDHCVHCATRAAHAEPLAGAFAETIDPPVPPDLVDRILLEAAELPVRSGGLGARPEIYAAGALLAVASLLLGLAGGLTPWMAEIGVSVRAAVVGGGVLLSNSPLSAGGVALGATVVLSLGVGLVVWRGRDRRR